ncbi:MAG: hypothetical protein HUK20_06460 [Fibrobacter sp.]|nr:hypothetical protein [Fibrobacter sp.]
MSRILLLATVAASFVFEACANSDPRGYQPVEAGNYADQKRLVRDGRDTQTYMMKNMTTPQNSEGAYMGEMPEAKVHYMEKEEEIKVDDKIDFGKI